MKLLNQHLEQRAIKSICKSKQKVRGYIFANLSPEHFYNEATKSAFGRIQTLARASGNVPEYSELCTDPALAEQYRKVLLKCKEKTVKSQDKASRLIKGLEKYRRLRGLYFSAESTLKQLEGDRVDPDELLTEQTDVITRLRTSIERQSAILNIGKGNNTSKLVDEILNNKPPDLIPTGFRAFDDENGGIFPGSLFSLVASTGGGKCLVGSTRVTTSKDSLTLHELYEMAKKSGRRSVDGFALLDEDVQVLTHRKRMMRVQGVYIKRAPTVRVTFEDQTILEGTGEHRVFYYSTGREVHLDRLRVGDRIQAGEWDKKVINLERLDTIKDVYDLSVEEDHTYMANGVLTHNSALANQMLLNMSKMGFDVVLVSLEMTAPETMLRILSNLSGIQMPKLFKKKLSVGEKKLVRKKYTKYRRHLKKMKTKYSIFSPEEDMTIQEILFLLKPYKYQVIIVDYISLLKGADGENSWKELGAIARQAKVFANANGVVVVLLAQLSDEGKVKYSRAISEHANSCWAWSFTDESKETGILDIRQLKARNQSPFSFQLAQDFSRMRVADLGDIATPDPTEEGGRRRKDLDNLVEEINLGDE